MHSIFDSHAHYDSGKFTSDRDEVLSALPGQGVRYVLNAGSDPADVGRGIQLAEQYDFVYAAVGIHPHHAAEAPVDIEAYITGLVKHPKVVAVGEIGLDYHYDYSPRPKQSKVFEKTLALAVELDMPVIIHDREAHADTMDMLRRYRPRGVMHCYSGSAEMAEELVKLGFYLGFTGVVTFKNARKALEAVAVVPPDKLLVETDCPYMAPEPYRGKRCDSSMLPQIITAMAGVKGVTPQEMAEITCKNACELFGIH